MINLTDQLTPIAPARMATGRATITMAHAKTGPYLSISRAAWQMLGEPRWVVVSLSRSQIAIESATETATSVRKVARSSFRIPARDILALFSVREGEKFVLSATVEDGRLIADLPSQFFTRYQYKARKGERP